MKKTIHTLVALALTMLAGFAHADSEGANADEFHQQIENYKKFCPDSCRAPFSNDSSFDAAQPGDTHLNKETHATLNEAAFDQAQIWADTILEGEFHADGKTRLDQVFTIYEGSKLIGYRITYSERAWYTGECQFDNQDEASLSECTEGRIQESSYVSADFQTVFRDENNFANFID